jgi:hypothetical protein
MRTKKHGAETEVSIPNTAPLPLCGKGVVRAGIETGRQLKIVKSPGSGFRRVKALG